MKIGIDIDEQHRKAAHNDKTGKENYDGRYRHHSVSPHSLERR